ncbi:MAG: pentapeptide repeat-containing protein [Nostoc sp. NOS(2021)]|uniref:pentapeptide repeat-containing protein n=1 Tax=Nostoc sp. NOS(2021) TaxID=2815407 RepID=UPI0025FC5A8E|nr:pentapeptide repeat-containing protein [Nostoc sp. NOS(2021)]MBN3899822.1 pentapeptide repeat-containing protein [Nostoc sp. NOS(2021)]
MNDIEEFLRWGALPDETIRRYETGERNFTGLVLRNAVINYTCFMDVNFTSADLQGCFFKGILVNTSFSYANLEGAAFYSPLINCNLSNANLREANLRGVDLTGVDLTSADLTFADLSAAKLVGANLRNADLTGIKTTESTIFCNTTIPDGRIETNSPKVIDAQELLKGYADGERDFRDIFLHRVDLSGVNLQSINLCGAHLSYVNLQGATLEGELSAEFICCDMTDIQLICASPDYGNQPCFTCCDLRRAKMVGGIDPFGAIGNNFQGSNVHFRCDDGDVFIQNTIWFDGEFIAGPAWSMEYWRGIRDTDLSNF